MRQPTILYTAVKALIKNQDGKVLILKQSDQTISGGNRYHPPGGIVELGETLEECITREIYEEVGVESNVEKLFDVGEWYAERDGNILQFIGLFYVCDIKSEDFKLQESEIADVYWVGLNEIDIIDIVEPSKSIIRKFLNTATS
jgi:8-oxo-dGTP diphosphatase